MKIDLLALARQEYAAIHPDRDTRQMQVDDALVALARAAEAELDRLNERLARLERKQLDKEGE